MCFVPPQGGVLYLLQTVRVSQLSQSSYSVFYNCWNTHFSILRSLIQYSAQQKSLWTKLWITFHCFHTKCIQWPHEMFSHSHSTTTCVIVWDNVMFTAHPRMVSLVLLGGEIYDHQPREQMFLLDTMNAGCLDISAEDCRRWIRQQRFFPRFVSRENIRCDVDENLRPNAEDKVD